MATAELPRPGLKICRDCGASADSSRCDRCLFKIRNQYRSRILSGQCVFCKSRACAGAFCLRHWFKNIGSTYGFNFKNGGIDLLMKIWEDQKGVCAVTRIALIPGHNASLDHIIPVSKGGDHSRSNLRWVLLEVNKAKADMTHQELLDMCRAVVRANPAITLPIESNDLPVLRSN